MSFPVRLGVSPAATSTSTGVFNQRFEALFPHAGALGTQSILLPHSSSRFICVNVGLWGLLAAALPALFHNPPPHWVCQLPPCCESSLPSCLSPPLLPVWVSVSSLSPWLSDFLTVRFSVSSGCFLFLNCCCPSFGCARKHSVSTYASILDGSPVPLFLTWGYK